MSTKFCRNREKLSTSGYISCGVLHCSILELLHFLHMSIRCPDQLNQSYVYILATHVWLINKLKLKKKKKLSNTENICDLKLKCNLFLKASSGRSTVYWPVSWSDNARIKSLNLSVMFAPIIWIKSLNSRHSEELTL